VVGLVDVNYVEYANNGLRLVDVGVDASSFLSSNGASIGALIGVIIALVLIIFIVAIVLRKLKLGGR
jgi:hypothetical protein